MGGWVGRSLKGEKEQLRGRDTRRKGMKEGGSKRGRERGETDRQKKGFLTKTVSCKGHEHFAGRRDVKFSS